jgi:hypothetical protein
MVNNIGGATTELNQPTQSAQINERLVQFVFYCAPRDDVAQNAVYRDVHPNDTEHRGVTDSASYLNGLPYVVIDADTKNVIYPLRPHKYDVFPRKLPSDRALHDGARSMHRLATVHVPIGVRRIALHIANDTYSLRRALQLFPFSVPDSVLTTIRIYEIRSDLQRRFGELNNIGLPPTENELALVPNVEGEYYGYLTGDLWRRLSHEFSDRNISDLCPPESLQRSQLRDPAIAGVNQPEIREFPSFQVQENQETLSVNWVEALAPICSAGANSRSMNSLATQIPGLNINLTFRARTFANAINCSDITTIQDAIRRTSPRAFAATLKAAWRQHIDVLELSSSWRPMLGSTLHKMGLALDITRLDGTSEAINFTIRNHGQQDRNHPFPNTPGGRKMAQFYQGLISDADEVRPGAVYTPWIHWVNPHDTHMHITVKDPKEE